MLTDSIRSKIEQGLPIAVQVAQNVPTTIKKDIFQIASFFVRGVMRKRDQISWSWCYEKIGQNIYIFVV